MPAFDHFALIAPLYARVPYSKTEVMREAASLPVRGKLLDVGGGTGRVASALRNLVDEIIIADVSMGMLKEAPLSVASPFGDDATPLTAGTSTALSTGTSTALSTGTSAALSAGLRPVCSGSESLPFADNSFERVIMVDALHHVIDQAHTAREMFRVLKPGGLLVIEEPDIRTFGVKLIAIAEKLLWMRSHFLAPDQIVKLFASLRVGKSSIKIADGTAWVIIEK